MATFDPTKLESQLCFPLYVASKELVRVYRPHLEELDLTYTQYIVMMALWQEKKLTVKELGEILYLDSGTLTPVLKVLEKKGYVTRTRSFIDERVLNLEVTQEGEALRRRATFIPMKVAGEMHLSLPEAVELSRLLYKVIGREEKNG